MAQSQRLFLAGIGYLGKLRDGMDHFEQFVFSFLF
jgi:hypothetical protein